MTAKIGNLSLEMALPIILLDRGEMGTKELFDIVKHKVSEDEFKKAIKYGIDWGFIYRTFERSENDKVVYKFSSRDSYGTFASLHRDWMPRLEEDLVKNTLMESKDIEITLCIKTKDSHVSRLIKDINELKYANVVDDKDEN